MRNIIILLNDLSGLIVWFVKMHTFTESNHKPLSWKYLIFSFYKWKQSWAFSFLEIIIIWFVRVFYDKSMIVVKWCLWDGPKLGMILYLTL